MRKRENQILYFVLYIYILTQHFLPIFPIQSIDQFLAGANEMAAIAKEPKVNNNNIFCFILFYFVLRVYNR